MQDTMGMIMLSGVTVGYTKIVGLLECGIVGMVGRPALTSADIFLCSATRNLLDAKSLRRELYENFPAGRRTGSSLVHAWLTSCILLVLVGETGTLTLVHTNFRETDSVSLPSNSSPSIFGSLMRHALYVSILNKCAAVL